MDHASNEDQQEETQTPPDAPDGEKWMEEARRVLEELERERNAEGPGNDIQRAIA